MRMQERRIWVWGLNPKRGSTEGVRIEDFTLFQKLCEMLCAAEAIMFSLCPVVPMSLQMFCVNMDSTRPQGGRVHYTYAAAEASYDCEAASGLQHSFLS